MKSFKSLGVCDELIIALQKQGIKEPTPIQEQSIPVVFNGTDVIAKAQTGTGTSSSSYSRYTWSIIRSRKTRFPTFRLYSPCCTRRSRPNVAYGFLTRY